MGIVGWKGDELFEMKKINQRLDLIVERGTCRWRSTDINIKVANQD